MRLQTSEWHGGPGQTGGHGSGLAHICWARSSFIFHSRKQNVMGGRWGVYKNSDQMIKEPKHFSADYKQRKSNIVIRNWKVKLSQIKICINTCILNLLVLCWWEAAGGWLRSAVQAGPASAGGRGRAVAGAAPLTARPLIRASVSLIAVVSVSLPSCEPHVQWPPVSRDQPPVTPEVRGQERPGEAPAQPSMWHQEQYRQPISHQSESAAGKIDQKLK